MRTTQTLSITLPPEMLERAAAMAKHEHRTMSELVREALRQYERVHFLNAAQAYGAERAATSGLREQDVVPAVKAVRKMRAAARKPSA